MDNAGCADLSGSMIQHLADSVAGRVWCPLCYSNRRGRSNHPGHLGFRSTKPLTWEYEWMALKRRASQESGAGDWSSLVKESFSWTWPTIMEFLCRSVWDDGEPRATGTIMLMVDQGKWKLWVHDRQDRLSTFVTGRTLEDAFKSLDGLLRNGNGDWRADRDQSGGHGRKRG